MIDLLLASEAPPTVLKSLGHHAVFLLLVQLALLLFMARLLGELTRKLGQPAVVGELLAGVVLGPSVFGVLLPDMQASVFPMEQHQADLLAVVSWLGVICLLIITGLETDLGLIKRRGRSALIISSGGILVPFASGIALGWLLPEAYLAAPEGRLVFALFMAVAMSISAVPVIAKVLMDLDLARRDIGQLILAAAMTDDTIGWILLSVVAGLATAGTVNLFSVAQAIGGATVFLLIAFTIGTPIISRVVTATDRAFGGDNAQLSVVLVIALGVAALTHQLGIEAVLGAFVIGILVVQAPRYRHAVGHGLEMITNALLAPIFFASAGLKVNLVRLADPEVLIVGGVVLAIACLGKFVGAYLGAWAAGVSHWERLALGSGMNARGAMEIVVATVGLGLGILTVEMYSIIVMVAIVTSLMAPPLLRWTLSRVQIGARFLHLLRIRGKVWNASCGSCGVFDIRQKQVQGFPVGHGHFPAQQVHAVDARGAFVDGVYANVAIMLLQRKIVAIASAAKALHARTDGLDAHFSRVGFGNWRQEFKQQMRLFFFVARGNHGHIAVVAALKKQRCAAFHNGFLEKEHPADVGVFDDQRLRKRRVFL